MNTRPKFSTRYTEQITALWTVFLLGTLFHTQIALMPLFHGLGVTESHTHEYANVKTVFWFMMIFFLIPMGAIATTVFEPPRKYRIFHFWLTVVYTMFNLAHLIADILVRAQGYQLLLMVFLVLIGLLLNWVSYFWMQMGSHTRFSFKNKV
jgi:hypothetical protein